MKHGRVPARKAIASGLRGEQSSAGNLAFQLRFFGFLRLMGELPHPAERRSKAVMLAKVPLAVLSFALVGVFSVGDI